jgi:hypothetical protein
MKGTQKKMLLLKNTGSDIFEEAYFILRDSFRVINISESEMIKEANRIVNANLISGYFTGGKKKRLGSLQAFILGLSLGVGTVLLLFR